jgi:hypothetical protein
MPTTIETSPIPLALAPTPEPPKSAPAPVPVAAASPHLLWITSFLILAVGILLRVWPSAGFIGTGFDEALYRDNIIKLDKVGVLNYPAICQLYIEDQRQPDTITKLPPTRFFYIYAGWLWKRAEFGAAPPVPPKSPGFTTRDPALVSLHRVAALFSCLGLIVSGLAAWRMLGLRALPGVLALMACSPLQIHLGQHALIDGVFTFWAVLNLWLLWENLQQPNQPRLLLAFAASLALMVLTKENSFFVYLALCGLVVTNRWTKIGHVTPKLLVFMFLGPALGVVALLFLAGSPAQLVEIYRLLVSKAQNLTYAIKTGDGPWYRYIVDMVIVNPIVVLLAIGGIFTLLHRGRIAPANAPVSEAESQRRAFLYLLAFVGFSYLVMCNIRYGMNLRYASIWELPVCALAAGQLSLLSRRFGSKHGLVLAVGVAAIFFYDLRQYQIFFTDFGLYELVTEGLVRAVKILK